MNDLLLYGCYGYTGRLLADEALRLGIRPTLAGRNRDEVEAMGRALGLPTRVFGLDDRIDLTGMKAVLHSAGPFSKTSRPMVDACLRDGVHYLDVTGEIAVFEALAARDAEARDRKIVIMPGVGFDVVPSDSLAAYVAAKVPDATHLSIALKMLGGTSQGTTLTMFENIDKGGAVRRDGRIVPVPSAYKVRAFDFGKGPRDAVTIPWGDVSTAYHSTKIPNIEVYLAAPRAMILGMKAMRLFGSVLAAKPVQAFVTKRIKAGPAGPTDAQRASGRSLLYAEAVGPTQRAAARLDGPEGYTLTAMTGIRAAQRVLDGSVAAGFQTPSRGLGVDFVRSIPGVTITDVTS